jgi:hypothetical protein
VASVLDQLVTVTQQHLAVLGQRRADGMNTLDWRIAVQTLLRDSHIAAAAIAKGGADNLDRSTLGFIGSRLREQYGFLSGLALDTRPGDFDGRAMQRLAQYGGGAVRGTASAITRRDAVANGHDQERNVVSGSAASCDECLALADLGWVDAGTLPEIGSRTCAGNDNCTIETRSSAGVTADAAA